MTSTGLKFVESIRDYKNKWAKKEKVDSRTLDEWENTALDVISTRIQKINSRTKKSRKRQILSDKKCLDDLQTLQKHFVLVPADKASSNILVVCKKYYLSIVIKELTHHDGTKPKTYSCSNNTIDEIVMKHRLFMDKHKINIPEEMNKLPTLYWLPKMHKIPVGSRFIAASSACTTKPLSQLLTTCLKTITTHFREYSEGIYRNTGVNCFWIIDNSTQVLEKLSRLNKTKRAKHFDSFDFSTLYTNIPHDLLLKSLTELFKEAYRIRGAMYLSVTNNKAYWSNIASSKHPNITEQSLIEKVQFLVDNTYVKVGNRIFKQTIGIPMGTDCAPLLANLFLFYYEYKFMKDNLKSNFQIAKQFSYTFRYIDDLLTLNNPNFEQEIINIYPPQLELKKTTETENSLSYLDLDLKIKDKKFSTSVYDKRDSFDFFIVNFPHLDSNIPSKPAYGVYISQLVRIGRICDSYNSFHTRHFNLTSRLVKQGFHYDKLVSNFKKFSSKYPLIFNKFGMTLKRHVMDGICVPLVALPCMSKHITVRHH